MNFTPTNQQIENNNIIASNANTLIKAGAGAGKSSSLRYFAAQNSDKNFLILCFNKSTADEGNNHPERPSNAYYSTFHSLAFGKIVQGPLKQSFNNSGLIYTDIKEEDLRNSNFFPQHICFSPADERFAVTTLRKRIKQCIEEYCRSNSRNLQEFAEIFFEMFFSHETILVEDETLGVVAEKNFVLPQEEQKELATFTRNHWLKLIDPLRPEVFGHDQYLKLFQLNNFRPNEIWDKNQKRYMQIDVLCCDECLTGKHYVKTSDGPWRIKRLVEDFKAGKDVPKILSYNLESKEFEYKKMLNGLISENRDVLLVTSEGLNKIHCTSNHPILTQRGYIPAGELEAGKDIMYLESSENQKAKKLLNSDQYQVMLGSFLGDGHLQKRSDYETYRLRLTQGIKQIDYLRWKADAFNINELRVITSGYTGKQNIYQSKATSTFLLERPLKECLKDIDALAVAIWYMDDGAFSKSKQITIHSNSFSYEDNAYLLTILQKKFGICGEIRVTKGYYCLTFTVAESKKLFELIKPYAHPDLAYKFPEEWNIPAPKSLDSEYQLLGANYIKSIVYEGKATVYDISVADNHNFVTTPSYYAAGVIVHNCQDMNPLRIAILDSFLGQKIVVGDDAQQLYAWNGAVSALKEVASKGYEVGYLTNSFRFTQKIADKANKILQLMEQDYLLTGGAKEKPLNGGHSIAYLSRTNAQVLSTLLLLAEEYPGKTFNINIDLNDISRKLYHITAVFFGEEPKFPDSSLAHIKTKQDLMEAMAISDDIAALAMLGRKLSQKAGTVHAGLTQLKGLAAKYPGESNIFVSTIHKAKGLEYDEVIINDDLLKFEKAENGEISAEAYEIGMEKFQEDFSAQCLTYVAITRAKQKVILPSYLEEFIETFGEM